MKLGFADSAQYQYPCPTLFKEACVAETSNSGSEGPGLKPRPSRCFLRQGTLLHFASLHPGV